MNETGDDTATLSSSSSSSSSSESEEYFSAGGCNELSVSVSSSVAEEIASDGGADGTGGDQTQVGVLCAADGSQEILGDEIECRMRDDVDGGDSKRMSSIDVFYSFDYEDVEEEPSSSRNDVEEDVGESTEQRQRDEEKHAVDPCEIEDKGVASSPPPSSSSPPAVKNLSFQAELAKRLSGGNPFQRGASGGGDVRHSTATATKQLSETASPNPSSDFRRKLSGVLQAARPLQAPAKRQLSAEASDSCDPDVGRRGPVLASAVRCRAKAGPKRRPPSRRFRLSSGYSSQEQQFETEGACALEENTRCDN